MEVLRDFEIPVTQTELKIRMSYHAITALRGHLKVLEDGGLILPRRKYEHRGILLTEKGRALAAAA